jgi:hypothetical protein
MKKVSFILLLIVVQVCNLAFAQTINLTGKILDSKSNKPLAGISINVNNSSAESKTNSNGEFEIANLKIPSTLIVTGTGYISNRIEVAEDNPICIWLTKGNNIKSAIPSSTPVSIPSSIPTSNSNQVEQSKITTAHTATPVSTVTPTTSVVQKVTADQKVETKYYRPSIATAIENNDTRNGLIIANKLKTLEMNVKFDDHRIEVPIKKKSDDLKNYMEIVSRAVVAKWYGRDAKGDFNSNLLAERGLLTANDADAMAAKAASIDRRDMLGEKLLGKTYVFMYFLNGIKTMDEVYNETDARNRKYQKDYKPVKRELEGFVLNYTVGAYRLNFNDSVRAMFNQNLWSDSNNHNSENVARWDTTSFPLVYVTSITKEIQSTQPRDPKDPIYTYTKKATSQELLEQMPLSMQNTAIDEFENKIEDFMVKTSIFGTNPLSAKIGKKENLKRCDRYFIYEIEVDANNNQVKKRKGVARAVNVVDNTGVATGDSKPSTFQQQGGKTVYEGMLLEAKKDIGTTVSLGYPVMSTTKALGGIKLGVDQLITFSGTNNLYFGIGLTANLFSDINPGNISAEGYEITDGTQTFSGYTAALSANFSKEIYFTRRGNIFLRPAIGAGISMYNLTSSSDKSIEFTIPDPENSSKKINNPFYSWTSWFVPVNCAVGLNITPSIVVELKPEIIARFAARTGSIKINGKDKSFKLKQNTTNASDEMKSWGFDKIDKMSIYSGINVNLRVRF